MSKEYKIAQDQLWSSKVANYTKEFPDTGKTLNRSPTKREADFVLRNYPEVTGFQTKSKASQCVQLISTGVGFSFVALCQNGMATDGLRLSTAPHFSSPPQIFLRFLEMSNRRFTGFSDCLQSLPQGIIILNLCLLTR